MKKAVIGILAHVDAGKTTLAEALLFKTGNLRTPGKVDSGNTVMDSHRIERERGITVFTSQAEIKTDKISISLLDTPGHIDFSAETERVLNVIDYAILVVSANDGVQSHTKTVWKLLKHYNIPVFIFVTKTDYGRNGNSDVLDEICSELSPDCIDFSDTESDEFRERIALCSDEILEKFVSGKTVSEEDIKFLVRTRRAFPVYFGSGLKFEGIDEFINGLETYIDETRYPEEFGAKVFKITYEKDLRLTHVKITGGTLKVKDTVNIDGKEEKINQIRIYNGSKFTAVNEIGAGGICALAGLENTYNGQGFGYEHRAEKPVLEPIMNFRIILPDDIDAAQFMPKIKLLEEEDPQLKIKWDSSNGEIQASLMGGIQAEILKSVVYDRFGIKIEIGEGNIQYKETIKSAVEGVGHYEPLRHYAEVHLVLEPLKRGSGLKFASVCSEDYLDRNWQRLILTHLAEKQHAGVRTGSELTDVRITLVSGRAHLKHTEGGDFRQATYRAVRNGLMNTESVLLEPYYSFSLEIPYDNLGRAINDIHLMHGSFEPPVEDGGFAILKGKAPVSEINGYVSEVASYTSGKGRLSLVFCGYDVCHNSEKVIEEKGYNPLAYRYLCLTSPYRKQLSFSYEILDGATNQYKKLKQRVLSLGDNGEYSSIDFDNYNNKFKECLSNDLNTSSAITVLFDLLKDNSVSDKTKKVLVESFDKVLSLDLLKEEVIDNKMDSYVKEMIELRKEAKKNKDYEEADRIRKELESIGIELIDTREGTTYKIK